MVFTRAKRLILGQPLTSFHETSERIPKWKALSTLSSDALSSVAYATDPMLFVLAAFSASAVSWSVPIALAIAVLLVIITASYRQTIQAYPGGGAAYVVAKENLGQNAGLVAGAALLIDYVLTVSVSVSAGVENIASAFPFLNEHRIGISAIVIMVIMMMNLRGIRESSTVFAFPTYFFVLSVAALIATGAWQVATGQVPQAQPVTTGYEAVPMLLLLRAFGAGCVALTGVEAISNGVAVFREPSAKNAKTTLVIMSLMLGSFFIGITMIAHIYGAMPNENETLISLLGRNVFGETWAYYSLQVATALILFLAANTSYTGFPRLASLLAKDRYLPRQLNSQGDRLVFSNGIIGLSIAATIMIILFRGETLHLIPLYAVGVFLSFTLSQAGMVIHHLRDEKGGNAKSIFFNALGAATTLVVLTDIAATRFMSGAWMVVIMIPLLVLMFRKINQHYLDVGKALTLVGQEPPAKLAPVKHTVIIPVSGIHQGVLEALRYALSISQDVRACYVELDPESTERTKAEWERWVPGVPFVTLKSPYRSVIDPLMKYIDDVEEIAHDDVVTIVIPEFITTSWWHRLLHNQTALFIRAALAFRRGKIVTSVRYHLSKE